MYAKSVGFVLLVTLSAATQAPDTGDRFDQAIRNDDPPTLQSLIREAGADTKDAQGQTPLMLAAAFGSPEAVRLLLASGADARASSGSGVTALHWATVNATKVRLLLESKADANAVSQLGRTPLSSPRPRTERPSRSGCCWPTEPWPSPRRRAARRPRR